VPEHAILPAVRALATRGLFVEPTAALPVAALPGLVAAGRVLAGERTVVVLTGSGTKTAPAVQDLLRAGEGAAQVLPARNKSL
jgi:threonine synthase